MKQFFAIFLILSMLLCVACSEDESAATTQSTVMLETALTEIAQLPRGLEGEWMSASAGERGYTEAITFFADGTLTVSSLLNGEVQQTIYGTFRVEGDMIIYEITGGTTPYSGEYKYVLDGRELYLIDDDQPAHYLRTS